MTYNDSARYASVEVQMKIQVTEHQGKVTIVLSETAGWIGLTPTQARELAQELIKGADYVEGHLHQHRPQVLRSPGSNDEAAQR